MEALRAMLYAMLVRGELVVKLPKARVDALVASGTARRFDAGRARPMKEWASVPVDASRRQRSGLPLRQLFAKLAPPAEAPRGRRNKKR